jgi:hypothetical protein
MVRSGMYTSALPEPTIQTRKYRLLNHSFSPELTKKSQKQSSGHGISEGIPEQRVFTLKVRYTETALGCEGSETYNTHMPKLHPRLNVSIKGKIARRSASGQRIYGFGITTCIRDMKRQ